MKKLTARWVRKAEGDWRAAQRLISARPPLSDEASFHCQQVVEKYLKALLQEAGAPIPKIHSLEALLGLLPSDQADALKRFQRHLKALSKFASEYRYPGLHASSRQARSALRWTDSIRLTVRSLLSIRST